MVPTVYITVHQVIDLFTESVITTPSKGVPKEREVETRFVSGRGKSVLVFLITSSKYVKSYLYGKNGNCVCLFAAE